jgi:hypothetical protein
METETELLDNAPETYGGDEASLRRAADDLAAAREAQPQIPDKVVDAFVGGLDRDAMVDDATGVTRVVYQDGRPKDQPTTAEQAARDYSAYRSDRAREILQSIDAAAAQQAEAEAAAQEPPGPSPEEQQRQQQEEAQRQYQLAYEQARAAELQDLQQRATEYSLATAGIINALKGRAQTEFSDIKTMAQAEALSKTDPARYQRLIEYANAHEAWRQHAAQVAQHNQQQQRQIYQSQFEAFAKAEDAKADQIIDEIKPGADPEAARRFKQECVRTLHELGMTDQDIHREYESNPMFRSAAAQQMLAAATRDRLGREKMRDLRTHKKPAAPVLKPGHGDLIASGTDHARLSDLSDRLARSRGNASIENAVALLRAQREIRG